MLVFGQSFIKLDYFEIKYTDNVITKPWSSVVLVISRYDKYFYAKIEPWSYF